MLMRAYLLGLLCVRVCNYLRLFYRQHATFFNHMFPQQCSISFANIFWFNKAIITAHVLQSENSSRVVFCSRSETYIRSLKISPFIRINLQPTADGFPQHGTFCAKFCRLIKGADNFSELCINFLLFQIR